MTQEVKFDKSVLTIIKKLYFPNDSTESHKRFFSNIYSSFYGKTGILKNIFFHKLESKKKLLEQQGPHLMNSVVNLKEEQLWANT